MKRLVTTLMAVVVTASLVMACSQAAPSPAPSQDPAPASTSKSSQPIGAAPAQPTAAPKVAYPVEGKSITMIVPVPAGGSTDFGARVLASGLEKELKTPIEIVNKPGAGGQLGVTEVAKAKPDGFTLGYVNLPHSILFYLDPDRQAAYGRKDLQPIATHNAEAGAIAVANDSPYKTVKDLVDAAKANPDKVKLGDPGIMTLGNLETLQLQQLTGAKFAIVHLDGGAAGMTQLLGGHVDAFLSNVGDSLSFVKGGEVRILGVADKEESKFLPGVKTMEEQGYKLYAYVTNPVVAPGGTPKQVVDTLSGAIKRVMESPEHKKKMEDAGRTLRYMDTAQLEAFWAEQEAQLPPLVRLAKEK